MIVLRPYQEPCVNRMRQLLSEGVRRILLVLPTGGGKGSMCAFMIHGLIQNGMRSMFLVNRRELAKDMSRNRLDPIGVDHGIIMAGSGREKPWAKVQIASIDTLRNRTIMPPADVIFADEAHFSVSDGWEQILARYPEAVLIGMTATPCRLDGRGLGKHFTHMVMGPTMRELIELGFLVPTKVYAPTVPDMKGVERRGGDFNSKQASQRMQGRGITGDIVLHWLKYASNLPTVGFACDVEHSHRLVAEFAKKGVEFRHVDANTPSDERDRTWDDLASGKLPGVMSVGIVSYGWDCPPVQCAILARPTDSLALFLQQGGRIVRSHPGKEHAVILDHAGNTLRHGMLDDDREWSLENGYKKKDSDKDDDGPTVRRCKQCWMVFKSTASACPECGAPYVAEARKVKQFQGDLSEVASRWYICSACSHRGRLQEGQEYSTAPCGRCQTGPVREIGGKYDPGDDMKRRENLERWLHEQRTRGYKPYYAVTRYKALYGKAPPKEWLTPAPRPFAALAVKEEGMF